MLCSARNWCLCACVDVFKDDNDDNKMTESIIAELEAAARVVMVYFVLYFFVCVNKSNKKISLFIATAQFDHERTTACCRIGHHVLPQYAKTVRNMPRNF